MTSTPLKVRRILAGLKQSDAAEQCGVSRQAISQWEHLNDAPISARATLAKLYGCRVRDLFSLAPRKGLRYPEDTRKGGASR